MKNVSLRLLGLAFVSLWLAACSTAGKAPENDDAAGAGSHVLSSGECAAE